MAECKTCKAAITTTSTYCQSCGAIIVTERLSMRSLFKKAIFKITNLDLPFYNTAKWLLTNPEKVTTGYIEGVRKIINSPIQFAIIVLSLYGFFQYFFSDFLDLVAQINFLSGFEAGFNDDPEEQVVAKRINAIVGWMQKHNQFLNFFLIPILGFLNLKFYRSVKYNLAEHIVIALYAISLSIFLVLILGFITIPFKNSINLEYYIYASAFVQIGSILWILQRSLKGAIYKPIFSLILSFIILTFIFISMVLAIMYYTFYTT